MASKSTIKTFASLLRNSDLIRMGNFRGAKIKGKVFEVNGEDLYVDFGMKFHAVVKKPQKDSRLYVRGAVVNLKLIDDEIIDKFIGNQNYTTILEADAVLLGLDSTPIGSKQGNEGSKKMTQNNPRETKLEATTVDAKPQQTNNR